MASLATRDVALDTICYWIGEITAISGDLDGIDPADYIE